MKELKPLIVVVGPTASGKTELALNLAKEFNGELINADSRQIYKEMDIATNKIDRENVIKKENDGEVVYFHDNIPIYLLDLITPNQEFSLAEYKKIAINKINEIYLKEKIPIIVGGTGLYIDSVVKNFQIPPTDKNGTLRKNLEEKNTEEIFKELQKLDPDAAEIIGSKNKRKLIRALEVCKISGEKFSKQKKEGEKLFNTIKIGITKERSLLYEDIDDRVEKMLKDGLIEETTELVKRYDKNLPSMSGIGYKEIINHLEEKEPLEEAKQKIKFRTHQYARRQITWFKKDTEIRWIENYIEAKELVKNFIKKSHI